MLSELLILCSFLSIVMTQSQIIRPPSIDVGPVSAILKDNGADYTVMCIASGTPQPTQYTWTKNGLAFSVNNADRITPSADSTLGSFTIQSYSRSDDGYYQCSVSNSYGTAVSDVALLRLGVLDTNTNPPTQRSVQQGSPFTLPCQVNRLYPNGTYSWRLTPDIQQEGNPYKIDRRVNIDSMGNLYFAYADPRDSQNGQIYKCEVFNPSMDTQRGGSYAIVNVISGPAPTPTPLTLAYSSPPTEGILGFNVSLRCLFKGMPEASSITWTRRSGRSLDSNRMTIRSVDVELFINKAQMTDEDTYTCTGSNGANQVSQDIPLSMKARPYFATPINGPIDINATDGDTVVMYCNATAVPPASFQWYMNGQQFVGDTRHRIDGPKLTFFNVCKSCPNLNSDLATIQCNASNAYGYVYAEGYINVLERTVITVQMQDVTAAYGDRAQLKCSAASDPSTPITYSWQNQYGPLTHKPGSIEIDQSAGTLTLTNPNDDRLQGLYTCTADNKYSQASTSARLTLTGEIQQAGIAQLWWVIVLLVLLLLLAILIFLCCMWLRRNRGDTYPVDDKERRHGHDPVKELKDIGFQDYSRKAEGGASTKDTQPLTSAHVAEDDVSEGSRGEDSAFVSGRKRGKPSTKNQSNV